ncbi:UDP-N-acetylmuramoylalanine--D-glutamate ligase [Lachnospiraceae bacterium NE2001]|nr:UDP-N-acetylmuramoylalanine--D-glutamate ligase [Lachnospiraceae bacterium NE2001]
MVTEKLVTDGLDITGKKVIVAGAGRSGLASSGLLIRNGVDVILYDGNESLDKEELLANFPTAENFKVVLGELTDDLLEEADLFVISPGIPVDAPFVNKVREKGIPIWGEIELAYYFNNGIIAAITGTNGKTTTTSLVGEIFNNYRENSIVVGNIGLPFTKLADMTDDRSLVALEVSSFQLETIHTFRPHVSAILNLTPDHLNRHYTLDNYYDAKLRIAENQTEEDYLVINYDDAETRERTEKITNVHKVYFSHETELEEGAYVRDGKIYIKSWDVEGEQYILDVDKIKILGIHNLENVLAATLIAYYMDIPTEIIRDTIYSFNGVEHRIEFVREIAGVKYYNDSKGTNPDAAIKAVQAMRSTTILIGGGYDKESDYDEWVETFPGKVRVLVLLGATADKIERCCKSHGFNEIVRVGSLKEAVDYCYSHAKPGESVLLSPACASWDMFKSYEERGTLFKVYVNGLEEK